MTRTLLERRLTALAVASVLALVAGCGGDDEPTKVATTTPTTDSTTAPVTSATTTEATKTEDTTGTTEDKTSTDKTGEDQQGGAGDEEAARTEVRLVGSGSKVRPAKVKVAPFIAIRVLLKTQDGHQYFVTFGNNGGFTTAGKVTQIDLDGLRPGKSYQGRYFVDGKSLGPVTIEATNEPGP